MNFNEHHSEKKLLAHWVYTREEWKIFMRREKLKKSLFHFFIYWLTPKSRRKVPEVMITPEKIRVGETLQHFNNEEYSLKRINILDAGTINVMEISYYSSNRRSPGLNEIRIPVPKGKLKEAIQVQEKLSNETIRG
ncbi:MAG TPA: hypothetical protein VET23_01440 [Chitinophagaceae bacterium]|nr:hypothetical protein [Chitinophagaceae bacterium]